MRQGWKPNGGDNLLAPFPLVRNELRETTARPDAQRSPDVLREALREALRHPNHHLTYRIHLTQREPCELSVGLLTVRVSLHRVVVAVGLPVRDSHVNMGNYVA